MHIHILGICGTFMGSLAQLAVARGHKVTGCDDNVYPPMSTQLAQAGIALVEGYGTAQLEPAPDLVVIGNALSRGNPLVEYVLDNNLPYTSGPQWFGDVFLRDKWVLAVAGTHGKTTTSGMLAWILDCAGMAPGFLIGGVPGNFGVSARAGGTPFFVVEADEYDTAFFDKRSKFVHYHPRTVILNNLEYDHADIFPDIAAIQTQFHHLIRTVPGDGLVIAANDVTICDTLEKGCWTPVERFAVADDHKAAELIWRAGLETKDGSEFAVYYQGKKAGTVSWNATGEHNVGNALAAIAAARHVGVTTDVACRALCEFKGVKRRMEVLENSAGVTVYDDFAHHPTAIAATLQGLRNKVGTEKIVAVIEPRSNTMQMGVHNATLTEATAQASEVLWYRPDTLGWNPDEAIASSPVPARAVASLDSLVELALAAVPDGGHIVVMSNGGFGGFHQRLVDRLKQRAGE